MKYDDVQPRSRRSRGSIILATSRIVVRRRKLIFRLCCTTHGQSSGHTPSVAHSSIQNMQTQSTAGSRKISQSSNNVTFEGALSSATPPPTPRRVEMRPLRPSAWTVRATADRDKPVSSASRFTVTSSESDLAIAARHSAAFDVGRLIKSGTPRTPGIGRPSAKGIAPGHRITARVLLRPQWTLDCRGAGASNLQRCYALNVWRARVVRHACSPAVSYRRFNR